jgi:hypothetical protein
VVSDPGIHECVDHHGDHLVAAGVVVVELDNPLTPAIPTSGLARDSGLTVNIGGGFTGLIAGKSNRRTAALTLDV